MRAHQLDANGVITNTIVVDSLDALPMLIDAAIGGTVGDSVISGIAIPKPAPPPVVPQSVTMRQAREALIRRGYFAAVNAYIAGMAGIEGDIARNEWEMSQVVERNRPLTLAMGALIPLDDAGMDELFVFASTL